MIVLFSPLVGSEEAIGQRIRAHLLVHDYDTASEEAREGVRQYTDSRILWEAWLQTLAKKGDGKEASQVWKSYSERFPDAFERREVLEYLAWGVIENGARSSSPQIRIMAMLGAFFSQDAKGVALLSEGLKDSNAQVRTIAVKLSGRLFDATLQDEIRRLFRSESNWQARLEVIRAAGSMRIVSLQPELVAIVGSTQSHAAEKAAAMTALVNLLDTVDRNEVEKLAKSDRAGLRQLACVVIRHLQLKRDADLLVQLVSDNRAEVRAAAWHTLGTLRLSQVEPAQSLSNLARKSLSDPDPSVAITAAWALTLIDPTTGQAALEPFLAHQEKEVRLLAAAALSATGQYGLPLAQAIFARTKEPSMRLNLALGLLGQRVQTKEACSAVAEVLLQQERWMLDERGGFEMVLPSTLKHDEAIANYPEAVNQMVRLELLNVLAVMKYPETTALLKRYLKERNFEISGMAAVLLLKEGDEEAVDAVQGLLKDPDQKIRTQAALILSLWGRGDEALAQMQGAYPDADRQLKEKILEGLGRTGVHSTIPFLVSKLQEPYPSLRLIAAAALLETLYH
ncbi:MAG: HEAT repeat domain-containing protein [Parachlamydia sp.]|nr:HEAT repeat domain-containing protein [Parachlamydia sp.]